MWHGPKQEHVHIYGITFLCFWTRRTGQGNTDNLKSKRVINTNAEEESFHSYHSSAKDTSGCSKSCRPGGQGEGHHEEVPSVWGTDHPPHALLCYKCSRARPWGVGVKGRHQPQRYLPEKRDFAHRTQVLFPGRTFPQQPPHSATTATFPGSLPGKP